MRSLLSAFVLILAAFAPITSYADDWGCEVLLCMSNPKGATDVAECVDPMQKLWKQLRKGKPFPKCDLGKGSSGTGAVQNVNHYPPCPAGTSPLPAGAVIDTGSGQLLRGFGSGDGMTPSPLRDGQPMPPLACVAGYKGAKTVVVDANTDSAYEVEVSQYAQVSYFSPRASGSVVDVYIDGKLFNRVPY